MKKLVFPFLLTAAFLFHSCTKTGEAGPQGEQGIQGVAGKDGGMFYSGTTAPAVSLGKTGDMYLDKATGNLYGPKTEAGWGTPVNLKELPALQDRRVLPGPPEQQVPPGRPGLQEQRELPARPDSPEARSSAEQPTPRLRWGIRVTITSTKPAVTSSAPKPPPAGELPST